MNEKWSEQRVCAETHALALLQSMQKDIWTSEIDTLLFFNIENHSNWLDCRFDGAIGQNAANKTETIVSDKFFKRYAIELHRREERKEKEYV